MTIPDASTVPYQYPHSIDAPIILCNTFLQSSFIHATPDHDEVKAFREACGDAHVKAILATGELGTLRNVMRASLVSMMAGADFIKTSNGKEKVNATLPFSLVQDRFRECLLAYNDVLGQ